MDSDLTSRLDRDEKILWQGAPPRGFMLRAQDAQRIPFSLAFLGFALFWEASVLGVLGFGKGGHFAPPIFFPLWGLMFVGIGLYMAVGRFFWDADVRDYTSYALTNKRALILRKMPTDQLRSFPLTPSSEITSSEDSSGRGTITFGQQLPQYSYRTSWPGTGNNAFMFERVDNVRDVLRVVRDVQEGRK